MWAESYIQVKEAREGQKGREEDPWVWKLSPVSIRRTGTLLSPAPATPTPGRIADPGKGADMLSVELTTGWICFPVPALT